MQIVGGTVKTIPCECFDNHFENPTKRLWCHCLSPTVGQPFFNILWKDSYLICPFHIHGEILKKKSVIWTMWEGESNETAFAVYKYFTDISSNYGMNTIHQPIHLVMFHLHVYCPVFFNWLVAMSHLYTYIQKIGLCLCLCVGSLPHSLQYFSHRYMYIY